MQDEKNPHIDLIGGPNGSGKSSFAGLFFKNRNTSYLNPDVIAQGFGDESFEKASFQAGRILITEVRTKVAAKESFGFESTLSGKTWLPLLKEAKTLGYSINIHFVCLREPSQNIRRIAKRVKMGGHNIPKDVVLRRYPRCFENFWLLFRPLCDNWFVFDNTGDGPRLVMDKQALASLPLAEQKHFEKKFLKGKITRG
jgi:predicted ABC-type ATPase